ncbi:DUF2125 domain-containing protein [Sulfitobacter sp. D35]|uniref:DUF2125 domain-containing protein n=1 Tax=Sulfitobacter sp. D35 TaxID=3083252 RepID=UPI00296EED7B|nr:DUF2125 domain-containing protein [Sulfitobacter sp. D35]MDW4499808.1 DUF2125 domain-containing protein [Sulfitobacter sp. D35]
MRLLLKICVVAVLAWCGWWWFAVSSMERGVAGWFEARRAEGWQADYAGITRKGFPGRLHLTIDLPAVADPETGVAVDLRSLDIEAKAWWPGDVLVDLPDEPIILANPTGRSFLTLRGQAALRTHPRNSLQLEHMSLTSGPWKVDDPEGNLVSADSLTLEMQQAEASPETYAFTLDAGGFQPGAQARDRFFVPEDWPVTFDRFSLEADVRFDRPWDRSALADSRPQPRRIDLQLAEAAWGDLRLKAAAELDIDARGVPEGEVQLQAQNWREILTLAEAAGALNSDFRPQLENVLGTLANLGGNPENFDVTLTFEDGRTKMGFLPLGPAPYIYLR